MIEPVQVPAAGVRFQIRRPAGPVSGPGAPGPGAPVSAPEPDVPGPAAAGASLTVVLAGSGGHPDPADPAVAGLVGPGRLLGVDLPGLGGSEALGRHDPAAVAAALAGLIVHEVDRGGLTGPVDVLGYELGGVVALALAGVRPELVRRLVVLTAPPPEGYRRLAAALAGAGLWRRNRALLGYAAGLFAAPPPPARPQRALVIWGSADRLLPVALGARLTGELSRQVPPGGVTMSVVPGAGHAPHLEAPRAVWPAVAAFLSAP